MKNEKIIKEKMKELKSTVSTVEENNEKSIAFCNYVTEQMSLVEVNSLLGGKYKIMTTTASAGSSDALSIRHEEPFGDTYRCLDMYYAADGETTLLYGDFNAVIDLPSLNDIKTFATDAEAILDELITIKKTKIAFPSVA